MKTPKGRSYIALFRAVMLTHHALQHLARRVATRFGLQSAELNVIDVLGKFGATTMGELARRTFISPASTTRTVKDLEARKLVVRRRHAESERIVMVALTPKGQALFRECFPAIFALAVGYFDAKLAPAERMRLVKLLEKLAGPMDF